MVGASAGNRFAAYSRSSGLRKAAVCGKFGSTQYVKTPRTTEANVFKSYDCVCQESELGNATYVFPPNMKMPREEACTTSDYITTQWPYAHVKSIPI